MLPRLLWFNTATNMKDLHLQVFQSLRYVFSEWADWKDPDSTRPVVGDTQKQLRKMIDFPLEKDGKPMTKAQFDELTDQEAFERLFSGVVEGDCDDTSGLVSANFDVEKMPYQLTFCDVRKDYFVPYNEVRLSEMLSNINKTRNESLFEFSYLRGKELKA